MIISCFICSSGTARDGLIVIHCLCGVSPWSVLRKLVEKEDSVCGLVMWKCANRVAFTGRFPRASLSLDSSCGLKWHRLNTSLVLYRQGTEPRKSLKLFQFPSKFSLSPPPSKGDYLSLKACMLHCGLSSGRSYMNACVCARACVLFSY